MTALRIYFNWFLINVLFCLFPIVISILIINEIDSSIISSIIAYCFTMLIASLYIFDRVSSIESSLKWFGFFLTFILLGIYVFYPYLASKSHITWIETNKLLLLAIILAGTLILSFVMNLPSMKDIIVKINEKEKFDKAKNTGRQVDDFILQLEKKNDATNP